MTVSDADGSVRYVRVFGHKELDPKVAALPIAYMDATMPVENVRHYMPQLEGPLDLSIESPHMRVTQLVGLPVGKSSLCPGKRKPDVEARVARKRQRLRLFAENIAQPGKRVLVITYKGTESDFANIPGVTVWHHGAVEGLDGAGDVDALVIIGRPLASAETTEDMAASLTGLPVVIPSVMVRGRPQKMVKRTRRITTTTGKAHALICNVFDHPEAETIRTSITEAALIQAIGRVRGCRRTTANPVEVFLICDDVAVPVAVDEVARFPDAEPDVFVRMADRGLTPEWGADAARVYPALFPRGQGAARETYRRAEAGGGGFSLICRSYKGKTGTSIVVFRPEGAGQRSRRALLDLERCPDPRSKLEASLGPLAAFEVLPEVAPQPVPEMQPVAGSEAPASVPAKPPPQQPRQPAVVLDAAPSPQMVASAVLLPSADDGLMTEYWLAYFNERAGILEYDNGLSRTDAEAVAFQDCVGELLNHNPTSHAGCSTDEAWRAAAIAALNAAGAAPSCHNGDPP